MSIFKEVFASIWMMRRVTFVNNDNDNDNEKMFISIELHIYKYRMQDINTLKISIKHYSLSVCIHDKGGMKPKLMCPNFCYTIENISFWGCRKHEMVKSDRRMTSFLY